MALPDPRLLREMQARSRPGCSLSRQVQAIVRYNRGMGSFQQRRQRWSWQLWFACLAILLNALTPALSYAFVSHQSINAIGEICSASGAVYSAAELGVDSASSGAIDHHVKHCPYCLGQAGSTGLPPAAASLLVASGHDAYPPLFYQSPQPLLNWLQAQPRGPPQAA